MRDDLEEEKRVAARRWAKREKQLDLIIGNTSGMYGDLQGLIGTPMQPIPALEAGGQQLEVDTDATSKSSEPIMEDDIPF